VTGEAPKTVLEKLLDMVEQVGNKVPHPAVLFFVLLGLAVQADCHGSRNR
jgi:aminobenzoyl-glutamate transport protein